MQDEIDRILARLGGRHAPEGGCLRACCALAASLLAGVDPLEAEAGLSAALARIPGGATFANARVALARSLHLRSEVRSGALARMLSASGAEGLVVLAVNPRLLYPGAAPGRHAVLLASSSAPEQTACPGLLDRVSALGEDPVSLLDPSRSPARQRMPFAIASAAFDLAGREALLVWPPSRGAPAPR